jgi:hypothetical protein
MHTAAYRNRRDPQNGARALARQLLFPKQALNKKQRRQGNA